MIKINLSRLLGEKRMTQKELSEKSGIRPGTINGYYHDFAKRFNRDDLNQICKVLNCSISDLMEFIPDK